MSLTKTLIFVAIACIIRSESKPDIWQRFKTKFSRVYASPSEEQARHKTFLENYEKIRLHNERFDQGLETYKQSINKFADKTVSELNLLLGTTQQDSQDDLVSEVNKIELKRATCVVPEQWDWRKNDLVGPVKNQQSCGSCWAFSTTGAIEAHNRIYKNDFRSLSEQQLLDCTSLKSGCKGGWPQLAYKYAKVHGLTAEENYAYKNKKSWFCKWKKTISKIKDFYRIVSFNETALKLVVACYGPVTATITVKDSMFSYSQGVYFEENCHALYNNHAIIVVGYGTENGQDYWLIQNTWGEDWGDKGFIKLARNKNFHCGITRENYMPKVI